MGPFEWLMLGLVLYGCVILTLMFAREASSAKRKQRENALIGEQYREAYSGSEPIRKPEPAPYVPATCNEELEASGYRCSLPQGHAGRHIHYGG